MAKFLVKYEAIVGRTKADGGQLPAVELRFCNIVDAASVEAANDSIVQYKDPGFVISIVSVTELSEAKDTLASELTAALQEHPLLKEQRG